MVFNGLLNGKVYVDVLKEVWIDNYGVVGCEWVKWLVVNQQEVKQVVCDV